MLRSDPEQNPKALRNAGFVLPAYRQVPQVWRIADPDELFEVITEGTVRTAATPRAQSPPARGAIRAALRDTVTAYKRGQYSEVPMPAVVATATKP